MRTVLALALLVGCFAPEVPESGAPDPDAPGMADLPPGRYVVLDASQAVAAGRQCSRGAPDIEAGWPISDDDAQAVERRLNELVEAPLAAPPVVPPTTVVPPEARPDLAGSVRQYVGAVVDERRVIYINAFPALMLGSNDDIDTSRPVLVCDGGADFWGVVFDLESGQFSGLAFNGPY